MPLVRDSSTCFQHAAMRRGEVSCGVIDFPKRKPRPSRSIGLAIARENLEQQWKLLSQIQGAFSARSASGKAGSPVGRIEARANARKTPRGKKSLTALLRLRIGASGCRRINGNAAGKSRFGAYRAANKSLCGLEAAFSNEQKVSNMEFLDSIRKSPPPPPPSTTCRHQSSTDADPLRGS